MALRIFARRALAGAAAPQPGALLLEGSWPAPAPAGCCSLDQALDGRFAWIDQEASRCAESLREPGDCGPTDWPVYLNALDLRYFLVKLLRIVAYFTQVRPLAAVDRLELVASRPADQPYADLLRQLAAAAGAELFVRWAAGNPPSEVAFPADGLLRRLAGSLATGADLMMLPSRRRPRTVFCGNPDLLGPVCGELLGRRAAAWWLVDRFALRAWLRWRPRGVCQLACNAGRERHNRLLASIPAIVPSCGINLAPLVGCWLSDRMACQGPRQTRLLEQLHRHFARVRPELLVLDEDATPLARAAVAVGRLYGAVSVVVQHGAPCCRFGFAPLVADRILVWGRSSRRQLTGWGIPDRAIRVVGAPHQDRWLLYRAAAQQREIAAIVAQQSAGARCPHRPPHLLLLLTTPPRDERPDAAALHLTTRSYAALLDAAFSAISALGPVRLTVRPHPRSGADPILSEALARFPSLGASIAGGSLADCLGGVDCVLNCGSSAGMEAALAGLPVIGLVPPGAYDLLSRDRWGQAGIARTAAELSPLVRQVLDRPARYRAAWDREAFEQSGQPAAARIADEILAALAAPATAEPRPEPMPAEASRRQTKAA